MSQQTELKKTSLVKPFSHAIAGLLIGSSLMFSGVTNADNGMADLKKVLQGQIELMKPELQDKVKGLSTDTKMSLMAILAMHSRYSDKATLRQFLLDV